MKVMPAGAEVGGIGDRRFTSVSRRRRSMNCQTDKKRWIPALATAALFFPGSVRAHTCAAPGGRLPGAADCVGSTGMDLTAGATIHCPFRCTSVTGVQSAVERGGLHPATPGTRARQVRLAEVVRDGARTCYAFAPTDDGVAVYDLTPARSLTAPCEGDGATNAAHGVYRGRFPTLGCSRRGAGSPRTTLSGWCCRSTLRRPPAP
jgi:hypothetical protein